MLNFLINLISITLLVLNASCIKFATPENSQSTGVDAVNSPSNDCFANLSACPLEYLRAAYKNRQLAFHVTNILNRNSILRNGLLPTHGGSERGCCHLLDKSKAYESYCHLVNNSRGYVFFSFEFSTPLGISIYYREKNQKSIIFGIRMGGVQSYEEDPDMEKSFKTKQKILPRDLIVFDNIDVLSLRRMLEGAQE